MTYCLAIQVKEGIAFAADTRSNAGVDYVSAYRKLHRFQTAAKNVVALLAAGSLATTQEVVSRIQRDLERNAEENLNTFDRMFEIAAYVGRVSQSVQESHHRALGAAGVNGEATFILGGQVRGEGAGIYLIYPQGNFIRASDDTPYLQIGENKYGKPLLDRIVNPDLTLDQAVRLSVLSLTATIKSNVSVGAPIDLGVYRADSFQMLTTGRLGQNDAYYQHINQAWDTALREAFFKLPDFRWPEVAHAPLKFPTTS
jgi:putative proteasome-type protease